VADSSASVVPSDPKIPAPDEGGASPRLVCRDGVAWLTLDDGRANAIGGAFCDALSDRLDRIEAEDVFAVVLRGRPGFFCGGLDLKELPDLAPDVLADTIRRFMALMHRLFLYPKPIVAAANGHAIAGGMMMYLCADVRLAVDREDAYFGLNEARTGIPLLGGTAGICKNGIPPAHHTELILHGCLVDPRRTFELGVTHELVADGARLDACAADQARRLEPLSADAYRLNKRILREPAWDQAVAVAERLADQAPGGNVFERIRR